MPVQLCSGISEPRPQLHLELHAGTQLIACAGGSSRTACVTDSPDPTLQPFIRCACVRQAPTQRWQRSWLLRRLLWLVALAGCT
jgi:hypothetical protein